MRPPIERRSRAWLAITVLVLFIGLSDYASGIETSLSIFYLVPISLAVAWLGARAGIGTAVACTFVRVASDSLILAPSELPLHTWWNVSAALLISLFIVWLLNSLVNLHRHLEDTVAERTSALRESVAERERLQLDLLDVSTRERNAIGRELHDELGQHLVATAMAVQVLAQKQPSVEMADEAKRIVRWIEEAIAKARKLARGLLLSSIEPAQFMRELDDLAAASSRGDICCRVLHQGRRPNASAAECAQFFRIAQEAVANALRYSKASYIDIMVTEDEHDLCLIVADDGRGISRSGPPGTGMGLRIMEHRARAIGASFSLASTPGKGTKVVCRLSRRAIARP